VADDGLDPTEEAARQMFEGLGAAVGQLQSSMFGMDRHEYAFAAGAELNEMAADRWRLVPIPAQRNEAGVLVYVMERQALTDERDLASLLGTSHAS